ncbi:hypothetical protein SHAb15599_00140 [Acinetobacter phage SH-Ab 15599]|nr:hypothetical protein SHAb15599_00140 [Acinetobacter phage SH-Ab 15599]
MIGMKLIKSIIGKTFCILALPFFGIGMACLYIAAVITDTFIDW